MSEFNRLTVVAAAEVILACKSHSDMEPLEVSWGVEGRCGDGTKAARAACLASIAINEDIRVLTERGRVSLSRALVELAIEMPDNPRSADHWRKLKAGLRFDGFEVVELRHEIEPDYLWQGGREELSIQLRRMLPEDVPEADFREAEDEVSLLLDRHGVDVAKGHLERAMAAFNRGEWSSANGELRNFYEEYLNRIADKLGYQGSDDSRSRRDFLGKGVDPPFLLAEYNEWDRDNNKPRYVQALMNRLHPHGGHPGLSEEEDATFRLQIMLITARLFLRRLDRRIG